MSDRNLYPIPIEFHTIFTKILHQIQLYE